MVENERPGDQAQEWIDLRLTVHKEVFAAMERIRVLGGYTNIAEAIGAAVHRMNVEYDVKLSGWDVIFEPQNSYRLNGVPYKKFPLRIR